MNQFLRNVKKIQMNVPIPPIPPIPPNTQSLFDFYQDSSNYNVLVMDVQNQQNGGGPPPFLEYIEDSQMRNVPNAIIFNRLASWTILVLPPPIRGGRYQTMLIFLTAYLPPDNIHFRGSIGGYVRDSTTGSDVYVLFDVYYDVEALLP